MFLVYFVGSDLLVRLFVISMKLQSLEPSLVKKVLITWLEFRLCVHVILQRFQTFLQLQYCYEWFFMLFVFWVSLYSMDIVASWLQMSLVWNSRLRLNYLAYFQKSCKNFDLYVVCFYWFKKQEYFLSFSFFIFILLQKGIGIVQWINIYFCDGRCFIIFSEK